MGQPPNRYSGISTINHWLTAVLIVMMLTLGFVAAAAGDETVGKYVLGVHIALGFFVFLFVLWRVAFRLYEGFPANVGRTAVERGLAYIVHRLLLAALVVQVFTGPLYLFTEGEGMDVFGWFTVYVPLESLSAIHGAMEVIHVILGIWVIPVLLILHFSGAIWHYLREGGRETPADM